jgi:hypothetical protein
MVVIALGLLIVILLFGLGFSLHILWWIAVVALAIWLLGFLFRAGGTSAGPRRRWFYW